MIVQCVNDFLTVTIGHDASGEIPTYAGHDLTVTAHKRDPKNIGYLLGYTVENPNYRAAILQALKVKPESLYSASRMLVYLYLDREMDGVMSPEGDEDDRVSSSLSALVVNVDWIEQAGQAATMLQHKTTPPSFTGLWATRHLWMNFDVKTLIAAGAAVRTRIMPTIAMQLPVSDQFKVVMDCSNFQHSFAEYRKEYQWIKTSPIDDDFVPPHLFQVPAPPETVEAWTKKERGVSQSLFASAPAPRTQEPWAALEQVVDSVQLEEGPEAKMLLPDLPSTVAEDEMDNLFRDSPLAPVSEGGENASAGNASEKTSTDTSPNLCDSESSMFATIPLPSEAASIAEAIEAWHMAIGLTEAELTHGVRKVEILGRRCHNWRWQREKHTGTVDTPAGPPTGSLNAIAVAAQMTDSVSHYQASYSDFKFWAAVEIALSLIVNIIFGFMG